MISNTIRIDSKGNGFQEALDHTAKVAAYMGLKADESIKLQLITEEMLSLVRSVTGEIEASFWIEAEGDEYDLHMTTETVLDKEKRYELIAASTSNRNEAATGLLGKIRDAFERAMLADAEHPFEELPADLLSDIPGAAIEGGDWDRYERSVLQSVADNVKIGIRGNVVDITIVKHFA